jgi:SAM-dependent methyltransferase
LRQRYRASPTFALTFSMDGRPYVAKEVEPYTQFWLSERDRVLLSLFSGPRGETVEGAMAAYLRLRRAADADRECPRLLKAISEMARAGVLVRPQDDTSRYDARMAQDYLIYRPFPPEIAELMVCQGGFGARSRALDLAGGPGSLALALAETSSQVTLMDLSRGFVEAARREAAHRGVALEAIHESANRLVFHDAQYDLITISQALHWLDDTMVCRGVSRILRPDGSFFVVLGAMTVRDEHPLSFILGDRSVLGAKSATPFEGQALALMRRLTLLLEAVDSRDVERIDPTHSWAGVADGPPERIVPAGLSLFRQTRPLGAGYVRAFMSPRHVEMTGMTPEAFWGRVESQIAAASSQSRLGLQDWAVQHFRRGGARWTPPTGVLPVTEIGWSGPAEG